MTISNKLERIRRQLGGTWPLLLGPGEKPASMHYRRYYRLVREYHNLLRLRDVAVSARLVSSARSLGLELAPEVGDPDDLLDAAWREYKECPDSPIPRSSWKPPAAVTEPADYELNRLTLGDIAQRANVPYAFALEAQQQGLVRADQGRGTRRRRYRERLRNWLEKLYKLRATGMTWDEIIAWTKRRFQPGHEHERVWPMT